VTDPTVQPHPANTYLSEVNTALADLPDVERAELMAEVKEHLDEALRELDAGADHQALVVRLGTPTAYAAELRASAGLAPLPEPAATSAPSGKNESSREWVKALAATPALRGSLSYLRDLRPAWWALRGYLLVALMLAILTQGLQILPSGVADIGPRQLAHPALGDLLHTIGYYDLAFVDPGPNAGHPIYLLIVLGAVIASVMLGRAAPRLPVPARLLIGALNLAAVFAFFAYPTWWLGPAFRSFAGL
jgi:hypothetical protein